MKRVPIVLAVTAAILAGCLRPQAAQAGQKEWATAGKILTGVFAVGVLANACAPPPPHREVVYCPPPPRWPCAEPSGRRFSHHRPPPRYYSYSTCPPPVRYIEREVVVIQTVPATETIWILNSNGSRTPVELRRADGGMYIGPKGEYYTGLPTNEQLRQIYGM